MGIYWKMEPVYVPRIPRYCTTLSLSLLAADKTRKNFIGFGGPTARPWKMHVHMTRKVRLRANEVATQRDIIDDVGARRKETRERKLHPFHNRMQLKAASPAAD